MLAAKKTTQIEYQSEAVQLPSGNIQKRPKSKRNPWGRYFFMVVIAVAIALSVISRYAAIARTGYEIAELKRTVATLEKEHEVLELTVASLKAPGRIQEIATSRLGMQLPDKVYYASAGSSATKKMVGNEAVNTASAPWIVSKVEARSNR